MTSGHPLHVGPRFARALEGAAQQYLDAPELLTSPSPAEPPGRRHPLVGVLQCRVHSGDEVTVERLLPSSRPVWELRIIPLRDGITPGGTFRLRFTPDGAQTDPISVLATADQLRETLVRLADTLGLNSTSLDVSLGRWVAPPQRGLADVEEESTDPGRCSPQRWLLRGWPGSDPPLLGDQSLSSGRIDSVLYRGDALRPRVESRWWGTGRSVTVTYAHAEPQTLLAGTLITAELVPGKGWVITSWEDQPTYEQPVTLETRVALPCLPQTLLQGVPNVAPVCGEHSPSQFDISQFVSGRGFTLGSPVRSTLPWLLTSGPLIHHEGNEWRTDWFGPDDHFQWRLSLYETDHGPQARLELVTATAYPDILIVYLSAEPWDCLALNRMKRISHLSRGTADYPVWRFPQCLGVAAGGGTCARPDPEGTLFDASACALYWSADIDAQTWLAGPSLRSESAVVAQGIEYEQCSWPAHQDDESSLAQLAGLSVEILVPRDPTRSAWVLARWTRENAQSQLYLRSLGTEPAAYDCNGYDLEPIEAFFGDDGQPLDPDNPPPAIPGPLLEPTDDPFPASLRITPWP